MLVFLILFLQFFGFSSSIHGTSAEQSTAAVTNKTHSDSVPKFSVSPSQELAVFRQKLEQLQNASTDGIVQNINSASASAADLEPEIKTITRDEKFTAHILTSSGMAEFYQAFEPTKQVLTLIAHALDCAKSLIRANINTRFAIIARGFYHAEDHTRYEELKVEYIRLKDEKTWFRDQLLPIAHLLTEHSAQQSALVINPSFTRAITNPNQPRVDYRERRLLERGRRRVVTRRDNTQFVKGEDFLVLKAWEHMCLSYAIQLQKQ
jgi:hypothetical protein